MVASWFEIGYVSKKGMLR